MASTQAYTVEEVELPGGEAVGIRETVPMPELPRFFGAAFEEMAGYIGEAGAGYAGPPFARYFSVQPEAVDVEAVFPVTRALEGRGRVKPLHLDATAAIQTMHTGPYEEMVAAYEVIERWLAEHQRERSDAPREVYLTGPEVDPADYKTLVVQPIR